jgi:hypothetical protein
VQFECSMFLMNKNLCIVMVVKFLIRNWISIVGCDYPHFNKDLLSMSAFAYPLSRAFYFVSLRFIYLLWGTLFRIIFTNNFIFYFLLLFFLGENSQYHNPCELYSSFLVQSLAVATHDQSF